MPICNSNLPLTYFGSLNFYCILCLKLKRLYVVSFILVQMRYLRNYSEHNIATPKIFGKDIIELFSNRLHDQLSWELSTNNFQKDPPVYVG